jgi:hypothetical protein
MSRSDSREYEPEERELSSEPSHQGTRASGGGGAYDSGEVTAGGESSRISSRQPEAIQIRNAVLQISPAEYSTVETIGKFRVLRTADLLRYHYGGESDLMRLDLNDLKSQGLIREERSMVTLTEQGAQLVEQQQKPGNRQTIYHGFVKWQELAHDTAIYRMYQVEAAEIRKSGGRIRRVVLDHELKKRVYSPLAKARELPPLQFRKRQAQIAAVNQLRVIEGKIPLPDLRIEYETASGEITKVDLELASEHYHVGHAAGKLAAGFKVYADSLNAMRLNAALSKGRSTISEGPELTASILTL